MLMRRLGVKSVTNLQPAHIHRGLVPLPLMLVHLPKTISVVTTEHLHHANVPNLVTGSPLRCYHARVLNRVIEARRKRNSLIQRQNHESMGNFVHLALKTTSKLLHCNASDHQIVIVLKILIGNPILRHPHPSESSLRP